MGTCLQVCLGGSFDCSHQCLQIEKTWIKALQWRVIRTCWDSWWFFFFFFFFFLNKDFYSLFFIFFKESSIYYVF